MPTMIERVAKAVWPQDFCEEDFPRCTCGSCVSIRYRLNSIKSARLATVRAVLEAMKEPTKEMLEGGALDPGAWGVDDKYVTEVYQGMIEAALKEGELTGV